MHTHTSTHLSAARTHLCAVEHARQVGVDDILPLLGLHTHDERVPCDACTQLRSVCLCLSLVIVRLNYSITQLLNYAASVSQPCDCDACI